MINDIFTYLLKSTAISAILYFIYYIWLRRESFFSLSRWYLLISLLISYTIPIISIKIKKPTTAIHAFTTEWQQSINQFQFSELNLAPIETPDIINWNNLLIGIYLLILFLILLRSFTHLAKIAYKIRSCHKVKHDKYSLILTQKKPAYSFFKFIFLPKEFHNTKEGETIICHETVHIMKKHSFDRVFIELMLMIFWFNPILHLIKNSLIEAHEYEADRDTTKEIESIQSYYNLVLDLAYCRRHSPFINHFSYKQLKKRIKMATHQSNPIKKGLIIVPIIVAAIIFGFASIELENIPPAHQWIPKKAVKWPEYISEKPDSVFTWRDIEVPAPSRIITKNNYILINKKNAIMFNGKVENEDDVIKLLTNIISKPAKIEEIKGSFQQLEATGIFLQRDINSDTELANNLLQKVMTIYNESRNKKAFEKFSKEFDQCSNEQRTEIIGIHPIIISFTYRGIKLKNNEAKSNNTSSLTKVSDKFFAQPIANKNCKTAVGWGYRIHPIHKIKKFHKGIDYKAPLNTKIFAIGNGTVRKIIKNTNGYGKHLIIDHDNGYSSMYAHVNDFNVTEGQLVKKGAVIAFVGKTGLSTAPHLHLEIMKNGNNINPSLHINYNTVN